jgi:tRNA-Thr(GGU) m(6)t(6)A37 methyltransferase TsaA
MQEISPKERETLQVHPRGRMDLPLLGAYATRTSHRPNPIGLTVVELVNVDQNKLSVRGLDAFDGTPVLDLKPFDTWDMPPEPRVPCWWRKLEKAAGQGH